MKRIVDQGMQTVVDQGMQTSGSGHVDCSGSGHVDCSESGHVKQGKQLNEAKLSSGVNMYNEQSVLIGPD